MTTPPINTTQDSSGLVGWAVATALFPIVGLVAGIVFLFRDRIGPGLALVIEAVAVFAVYVALLAPAQASAFEYPGQVPVTDPISIQAIAVATNFWRERGLTACPNGVQTFMASSLMDGDGIDAFGRGGDCEAALAVQPLRSERTYLDAPTYKDRRFEAADECREWTHEVGHALGLGHTDDGGVMDPVRWTVPYDCLVWAHHLYPAPARVRSAASRSRKSQRPHIRRTRSGRRAKPGGPGRRRAAQRRN